MGLGGREILLPSDKTVQEFIRTHTKKDTETSRFLYHAALFLNLLPLRFKSQGLNVYLYIMNEAYYEARHAQESHPTNMYCKDYN